MTSPFPLVGERYEILAELGSGGMGIVYKARDRETRDVVALKVLHASIAEGADQIERLRTELRLARKVTHKNVCRVYDINRTGDVASISMEYLEGEGLRAFLNRRGRLPLPEALDIIGQVVAGLKEAHAQGVVHRDLKPENIFVTADGVVKVMDFGIARNLDALATTTAAGMMVGSPAYMSPEQIQGKSSDARSDIYSLGMVMYEMVCGRRAFAGDTPIALAMQHVQEPPSAPRALVPDLPAHVDAAILKCLEKDPLQRHQSLADVERALDQPDAVTQSAPAIRPSPSPPPLKIRTARWRFAIPIGIAAAAVALWYARADRDGATPSAPQTHQAVIAVPARSVATQQPAAAATDGRISVAALEFQSVQGLAEFDGLKLGIADAFTASLARTARFRVVERTQLDQALKELDLNQTDRIDASTAQRVGKLIGAQYMVVGSFQVIGGQIKINARLVRVETAEVVHADSATGPVSGALTLPDAVAERLVSQIK